MSRPINYFKLGLFILIGFFFLASTVIILGAGKLFTRTITLETYINESINGLEVGSTVKYRGVKIGAVKRIGFVLPAAPR